MSPHLQLMTEADPASETSYNLKIPKMIDDVETNIVVIYIVISVSFLLAS
jgi:hypothetical protein